MSNSFDKSSTSLTPNTSLPKENSASMQILIHHVSDFKDIVSKAIEETHILKEGGGSDGGGGEIGDETQRKEGDEADPSKEKPSILKRGTSKNSREEAAPDDGSVHRKKPDAQIDKLQNNLEQIKTSLEALKHYEEDFEKKILAHTDRIRELLGSIKTLSSSPDGTKGNTASIIGNKLWEINKEIIKLKHRIPSSSKFSGPGADHHDESQKTERSGTEIAVDGLLSLYSSKSFSDSSFYNEIQKTCNGLSKERKDCLLCFAVFSENEELKKRMLAFWWEGEGFLPPPPPGKEKTIEELAGEILDDFVKKGLIKPVYKRRRPIARSYRMEPVVRSVIVKLAGEIKDPFFSYDEGGNLTGTRPVSGCKRACLVKSNKKPNSQEKETQNTPMLPSTSVRNPQPDEANSKTKSNDKPPGSSSGKSIKEPEKVPSRSNSQGQEPQNTPMSPSTTVSNPQPDEANSKTRSNKNPSGSGSGESNKESSASPLPEKAPSRSNSQAQEPQNTQRSTSRSNSQKAHLQPETNLVTIFNVNEPFPDLRLRVLAREEGDGKDKSLEAEEWLSKMKALRVLSLGTWRASSSHHIEVDRTEFLKGLTSMTSLRLLSLQGISRINELTESIKGVNNLRILDLKACHNLEKLPREISYLKNLTHLDVSACYMIDHLPRGLSYLTNLQVLKGFVVADHKNRSGSFCTFDHLGGMKKLRKLSIIVSKKNFPAEIDMKTFENLDGLKNLSLLWGADSNVVDNSNTDQQKKKDPSSKKKHPCCFEKKDKRSSLTKNFKRTMTGIITEQGEQKPFKNLEKLDLQCYPEESPPNWLRPRELDGLKKLYIRGGKLGGDLRNFPNESVNQWQSVETLRLKYLAGLKMNWEEMKELFPKLSYLEKVDCPLITMCPCDEDGVWVKYGQEEKQSDHEQEPADQKAQKQSEIRSEQRSGASAI